MAAEPRGSRRWHREWHGRCPPGRRRGPIRLTDAHKQALAAGREESRHVRAYLDALDSSRQRRVRRRPVAEAKAELTEVTREVESATGFRRLELISRRIELENELGSESAEAELRKLRDMFVRHAASYARRRGIPRQAFKEWGVPAADVREAGIE